MSSSTTKPVIITVAITGAVPRKKDNPAVPVTPEQQVESTHEAFEAGAALVHIHVRNPDESPGSDPELYGRVQEGVRKHCPGMIVQFSTGGRGREQEKRGAMLELKPDMASLATGSVNFPNGIYENAPDFVEGLARTMLDNGVKPEIEVFDLAMLYNAANLVKKGLLKERPHVQFVLGVPNAMPARRSIFDFLRSELAAVLPDATWVAAGIGRHQWEVNQWCLEDRRTLPHRPRGQHAHRAGPACGEQRRAREQDRRALRALRSPARHRCRGASDSRLAAVHCCGTPTERWI